VDLLDLGTGARGGWAERIPLDGRSAPLRLDMHRVDQVDPPMLVRLAALIDRHAVNGGEFEVRLPQSTAIRRQLESMRVDSGSEILGISESSGSSTPVGVLPVTRFSAPAQVDLLASGLNGMLNEHFSGPLRPFAQPLFVALSELCDNATTHGKSPLGAYVAATRDARGRCSLAVGDLGVGIPAHLRRALPKAGDDGRALERAMSSGISGAGTDRGGGYTGLFAAIEKSKAPTARLRVWSASGRMTATLKHGRLVHKEARVVSRHTDGTWISLELFPV